MRTLTCIIFLSAVTARAEEAPPAPDATHYLDPAQFRYQNEPAANEQDDQGSEVPTVDQPEIPPDDAGVQDSDVTDQDFHQALDPYGTWQDDGTYGQVWRPTVEDGWRPYSHGHWAWTEAGWTWVSDYAWGWAPFHYGRWIYDDVGGWGWIPGHRWAGAWVSWAVSGAYWGWSPLGPRGWRYGGWTGRYWGPARGWSFVNQHDLGAAHLRPYQLPFARAQALVTAARPMALAPGARGLYASGPPRAAVAQVSAHPIVQGSLAGVPGTPVRALAGAHVLSATNAPVRSAANAPLASHWATPAHSFTVTAHPSPVRPNAPGGYAPSRSAYGGAPRYASSPQGYGSPRYSAPSSHYSSPSHYSAPSHSSFSGGGSHSSGGFHGGGSFHGGGGSHGGHR